MKFTLFLVLSCLSIVCLVSAQTVTNFGYVGGNKLGTETVVVKSTPLRVKEFTLTYPKVRFIRKLKIW